MKNKITIAFIGALIVTIAVIAFTKDSKPLGYVFFNSGGSATSTVNVATTTDGTNASLVLDINEAREYAYLCNAYSSTTSASDVYLNFIGTSTGITVGEGLMLEGGECYEMDYDFLWLGQIWAIASSSTSTISIVER